jgi:hypothetical protein
VSAAGAGIAQKLYDEFIAALKKSVPQAKAKLGDLAKELAGVVPQAAALAKPVIEGLDAGAAKAVDDAALCRSTITGLNLESAKGVFGCLKLALRSGATAAGARMAGRLFDQFVRDLRAAAPAAKAKLRALSAMLATVVPAVKALAKPILDAVGPATAALADDALVCRSTITGLNAATAKGVFQCLALVFRKRLETAGASVAQALYDQFVSALRASVSKAKTKLQELTAKLAAALPSARSLAKPVLDALDSRAARAAPDAALCRRMITGFNPDSAKGLYGCLALALRGAAGAAANSIGTARALFQAFAQMLRTNVAMARTMLNALADVLSGALPTAKSLAAKIGGRLRATAAGPLAGRIVECSARLQRIDAQSAGAVLGCVQSALAAAPSPR